MKSSLFRKKNVYLRKFIFSYLLIDYKNELKKTPEQKS